jgi:hypothetical protein
MLILGLLGVYFDAAVVFVTKSSLLFRLAVAIHYALVRNNAKFLSRFYFKFFTDLNVSIDSKF